MSSDVVSAVVAGFVNEGDLAEAVVWNEWMSVWWELVRPEQWLWWLECEVRRWLAGKVLVSGIGCNQVDVVR